MRTIWSVTDSRSAPRRLGSFPQARVRIVAAVVVGALATACSATASAPPAATAPGSSAATSTAQPSTAAAMAAYGEFWRVSELAFAAPGAQDWEAEMSRLARGQALIDVVTEIQNYTSVPAHVEGRITHDATLDPAVPPAPDRVAVLDCVDISGSTLVADQDGSVLDDRANQSERYRYRAEVVRDAAGRWLVETTAPFLDEPC